MKILLDTHYLLWSISDPEKLGEKRIYFEGDALLYVSAVSFAEIAIKKSLGKLKFDTTPKAIYENMGYLSLALTAEETMLLAELPFHHRDPFDRMLVVQASFHGMHLMSDDAIIKRYGCKTI